MKVLYALSHISYLWNKFLYLQNSLPSIIIISESSGCLYVYCSTFPSFISELPYTLYCSLIFCLILMPTMCRQWNMQASMTHIALEDGCFVLSLETNFAIGKTICCHQNVFCISSDLITILISSLSCEFCGSSIGQGLN